MSYILVFLLIPYSSKIILPSKALQALTHWYINHYSAERTREVHKALSLIDELPNIFLRWKDSTEKNPQLRLTAVAWEG